MEMKLDDDDSVESDDGYLVNPHINEWLGDSLTDQVMRIWMKRKTRLVHEYALVGYLLQVKTQLRCGPFLTFHVLISTKLLNLNFRAIPIT